jgi:hypothetical protein
VRSDPNQPAPIVVGVQRSRAALTRRFMEAERQRREDTGARFRGRYGVAARALGWRIQARIRGVQRKFLTTLM